MDWLREFPPQVSPVRPHPEDLGKLRNSTLQESRRISADTGSREAWSLPVPICPLQPKGLACSTNSCSDCPFAVHYSLKAEMLMGRVVCRPENRNECCPV